MDFAEYPKALYRDGGAEMIWGKPVQTRVVGTAEEQAEALAEGWRLGPVPDPLDHDGDGRKGGSLPRRGRPPKVRTDDADTD